MSRVLILGSTDFTHAVADAIVDSGIGVAAIVHVGEAFKISYAQKPVTNYRHADIAGWCAGHGAKVIAFDTYSAVLDAIEGDDVSLAILAGWYHLAPKKFRAAFPRGCVGFHASLLPKLRGGAPLNWAILNGLTETGLSLFEVGDGVDDGPLYDQERFAIGPRTRIAELVEASRQAGEKIVKRSVPAIMNGSLRPSPQAGEATFCLQRTPEDGRIDWRKSAGEIGRLVRAVGRPYPGGLTSLEGRQIAIHDAAPADPSILVHGAPGQLAYLPGRNPVVVCGGGCLVLLAAEFADGADALPAIGAASNKRLGS